MSTGPPASPPLAEYHFDLMCYSCEWSPFDPALLAVSTAQHFGIIGAGKQNIVRYQNGVLSPVAAIETKDGVYDCAWSETAASQIAFASGDGSVKLWDYQRQMVLKDWREHTAEVYSVDWNLVNKDHLVSGSWDFSIKLWHPEYTTSVQTFKEHTKPVYSTIWHPKQGELFASASGDGTVKIWDLNAPGSSMTLAAHPLEVLSCDWNKYDEFLLFTGSVDKSIRGWDIRNSRAPVVQLEGHEFAVRRLKCSPFEPNRLISTSYDMSAILWDISLENSIVSKYEDHTEFVLGCDWNLFDDQLMATCGWDEKCFIHKIPIGGGKR